MTNAKVTRRAMLLSLTALLVCAAMLVGTTFAWFTDSVNSGVNRIVAGNLDVELYHTNAKVSAEEKVDENQYLFQNALGSGILWEPGAVAYETFKVKNEGSLSLDYKLGFVQFENNFVVPAGETAASEKSLLDVIRVRIDDTGAAPAARPAFSSADPTLGDFKTSGAISGTGTLAPNADKSFTVVLYWPSDTETPDGYPVDNDYNLKNGAHADDVTPPAVGELWVKFGVQLVATQHGAAAADGIAESDSFGPDYDVNATYPVGALLPINDKANTTITAYSQENGTQTDVTIVSDDATSQIPAATKLTGLTQLDEQGNETANTLTSLDKSEYDLTREIETVDSTAGSLTLDISFTAKVTETVNDVPTETSYAVHSFDKIVANTVKVGKNLEDVKVKHNNVAMNELETNTPTDNSYYYDADSGMLYIYSSSYSEYAVTWTVPDYVAVIGSEGYMSLADAIAAVQNGEKIILLKDVTTDDGYQIDKADTSFKIDLSGKTVTVNSGSNVSNRAFRINNGSVEVYNGTIVAVGAGTTDATGTGCYGAFRVEANGVLNAHDLSLTNARPWGLNVKVLGGEATLTRVNITSSYGGGIEVTEANLGANSKKGTATLTDCYFTQTGYFDHCSSCLSVSGGSTLTVNSGNYTSDNYALYVFSSGGVINVNGGTFRGNKDGFAIMAQIDANSYPNYTGGLAISGGNFSGGYTITLPAYMVITGGTFDHNPTAYLGAGCVANDNNDGTWTVQSKAEIAKTYAEAAGATDITMYTNSVTGVLGDNVVYEFTSDGRVYVDDATNYNGNNGTATPNATYYITNGVVQIDGINQSAFWNSNVSTIKITGDMDYAYKAFCGSADYEVNNTLTTVEFGDGVTVLPNRLFCNCTALTSITLPNTITTIGQGAFRQSGLTSLTIPESVETIDKELVAYCPNITTLTINGNAAINQYYIGRDCSSLTSVTFTGNPTFTYSSKCMTFSKKETGEANAITVYFASETVRDAFAAVNSSNNLTLSLS